MRYRHAILALMALPLAISLACGGGGGYDSGSGDPTSPPTAGPRTVQATPSQVFTPAQVTVVVGDAITWAFGSVAHNVFFDPQNGAPQVGAPADIPGDNANTTVSRTFTTAGTFRYDCHLHPGMRGTVLVVTTPPEGY